MSGASFPPGHTIPRSEAGLSLKSRASRVWEPGIRAPELSSKVWKICAAKRCVECLQRDFWIWRLAVVVVGANCYACLHSFLWGNEGWGPYQCCTIHALVKTNTQVSQLKMRTKFGLPWIWKPRSWIWAKKGKITERERKVGKLVIKSLFWPLCSLTTVNYTIM